MQIEGSYVFDAPQELVWEMALDPVVLEHVMHGCERLEQVDDDEYKGRIRVKVGPVQSVFQGKVKLSDLEVPTSYRLKINGRGPAGIIDGAGDVRLEADGDKTIMHYAGDAKVSGRLASVGQRVMESSARAITHQSLEDLDKQIQSRLVKKLGPSRQAMAAEGSAEPLAENVPAPESGSDPAATATAAPHREEAPPPAGQGEYAFRIAKEICDEFVPAHQQRWAALGIGLLLVYLLINGWTNLIARRVARELQKGE